MRKEAFRVNSDRFYDGSSTRDIDLADRLCRENPSPLPVETPRTPSESCLGRDCIPSTLTALAQATYMKLLALAVRKPSG